MEKSRHGCILLPIFQLKSPSAILEKWELELADTPDDDIDLELSFKFLNLQVVSKEAGERNRQGNLSLKSRSTNKGRDGRRNLPFIKISDQEQVSTAPALFSEAKSPTVPSCRFCKGGHGSLNCPMFNGEVVNDRWKLVEEIKLRFNRLKPTNSKDFPKSCRQPKCPVVNCGKRHHKPLHSQPLTGICKRVENPDSLVAVESYFGWILTGPVDSYSKHRSVMLTMVENNEVASLSRFWELESIGITETANPTMSQEEELAVNDFNDGLNFDGNNYEVGLPWRRDHPKLENNYAEAGKRLENIERKLKRDPEKAEAYTTAINQYVQKGIAVEMEVSGTFHIMLFSVLTDKQQNVESLSMSVSLLVLLCNPTLHLYSMHRVGMIADVEKMYLQIKLAPKDQDLHRYLWRDLKTKEAPKAYRMLRLTFGVNSSPFLAITTPNAQ